MGIGAALLLLSAGEPQMAERYVRVRLTIGSDSRVSECVIVESDAPQKLQDGTCEVFLKKGKFTVSSTTVEQTVLFRLPVEQSPQADASAPSVGPLTPFRTSKWIGQCRPKDPSSAGYLYCEARLELPQMSVGIYRNQEGIKIDVHSAACGLAPVGSNFITRDKLDREFRQKTFSIGGNQVGARNRAEFFGFGIYQAMINGRQRCPSLSKSLTARPEELEELLAATDQVGG